MIPFLSFDATNAAFREEAMTTFERFFDSKWYVLGEMTKQFEIDFAEFNQVAYSIGISNGLDALQIALRVLHIGPGDEVIVPSNTYIATALAVSYVGATPVFVEPNPATYNIDPARIEAAITRKTKAIMPVHLYGQACEMDEIMRIAKKHGLFVVEDNAQAHGAAYNGVLTGTFGELNATSFYPSKNVGALGEAGAITTNDADLAQKVRVMRNYGSQQRYYNEIKGFNARIDELQAGLLSVKLKHIAKWTAERRQIASWYFEELDSCPEVILPFIANNATHVFHLFVIKTSKRDELQKYLQTNGVGTVIHYPIPPHLQQAYQDLGFKEGDFPIAEEIANTVLSIPLFIGMSREQVKYVSDSIKNYFSQP
ncbi:MAG: DegT/DnrJ/EryC1/StrS family aminotransferase [Saprospiraceae bacterium]